VEKRGLTLNNMQDKKLIAITGGIGSGKSTALQILSDLGYKTLTSDKIVSELYEKQQVRRLLKPLFPDAVTGKDFVLDRKKIADEVFANKQKHQVLTELITPMVMAEIIKRTTDDELCFVEVPLLFECGFEELFDGVIVVSRSLESRIESVIARSNLTREQVLARINNQFDYENADLSSYTVIINDFDQSALKTRLLEFINTL
jgi:dephospho-CoA kinase